MSLSGILPLLQRRREFLFVSEEIARRRHPWVTGPAGSAKACLIAACVAHAGTRTPAWIVLTPTRDQAEKLADDLSAFLPDRGHAVHVLAPWDTISPEDRPSVEAEGARQQLLEAVRRGDPVVVVAAAAGVLSPLPDPTGASGMRVALQVGGQVRLEDVAARLSAGGYERVDLVGVPGQMAVRGGLIDVFPSTDDRPVRIEWVGDEVESIRVFEPDTQRTVSTLDTITVLAARVSGLDGPVLPEALADARRACSTNPRSSRARRAPCTITPPPRTGARSRPSRSRATCLCPSSRGSASRRRSGARGAVAVDAPPTRPGRGGGVRVPGVEPFAGQMDALARHIRQRLSDKARVVLASRQGHRMAELLAEHEIPYTLLDGISDVPEPGRALVIPHPLTEGFALEDIVVITDSEILGWHRRAKKVRWMREGARLESWTELVPGDLVVHIHHGIGLYRGLERLAMGDGGRDYLHLEYAQGDTLYVPTDQINLVQRYVGADSQTPQINRLGGTEWEREKRRVRERTREMAQELLQLDAARERTGGHAFAPDTPWQREMEDAFPYEETPDQLRAIEDVKRDMEAPRPMDRLVCGDVGYGKTEVALRAAFKAVMDGKQVAVLVPTTLLAQQHGDGLP